jgi:membrane protease YdiL (CAAX protease family)
MAIRATGYERRDIGLWLNLSFRGLPIDLLIAAVGISVGYLAYGAREPSPLVRSLAPSARLAEVVVVVIVAAFAEELVFRGLIQSATRALFGTPIAVVLGASLGAAFLVGHRSPDAVGLVFATGLIFGSTVATTRSLLGVTLARSIAYVCLLVVFPLRP